MNFPDTLNKEQTNNWNMSTGYMKVNDLTNNNQVHGYYGKNFWRLKLSAFLLPFFSNNQ